jgi:hypothetical protein
MIHFLKRKKSQHYENLCDNQKKHANFQVFLCQENNFQLFLFRDEVEEVFITTFQIYDSFSQERGELAF